MTSALIVAAGQSSRMGGPDKLFLSVAGKPLVAHAWAAFDASPCIDEIILVVRPGKEADFRALASECHFKKRYCFASGGNERQESVCNGLAALDPNSEWVAIQDGARPCISQRLIRATLEAAHAFGAAVAAQKVTDTIKEAGADGFIEHHIDRSKLWAVQTPQTFRVSVIRQAIAAAQDKGFSFTDDTAACALIGQRVRLVESQEPNPKLTTPADIPYLESLLGGPWSLAKHG